jgi:hypothetical protein
MSLHYGDATDICEVLAKSNAKMDANQAEIKAGRKADQARIEASREDTLSEISGRIDANTKKR